MATSIYLHLFLVSREESVILTAGGLLKIEEIRYFFRSKGEIRRLLQIKKRDRLYKKKTKQNILFNISVSRERD